MTAKRPRILVVDDDPELRSLMHRYLEEHGFQVRSAADGQAMDQAMQRDGADLIVLDLMMPGEDGLAILRRLRGGGESLPVIMLTARGDPVDRVLGLELGADDYVAKPFHPRELVARISVQLRRITSDRAPSKDDLLVVGGLEVNLAAMSVKREGRPIPLSSREFALLAALARSPGRVLSRAQLIDRALGRDAEVTDRVIDVQIARLRKALGDDAADPTIIRTVWGVGYVLAANGDA
ncbi:two-component system phosphate regulon response regulator OmpR [Novosphingobium kunmingense]|uniref:Two-component system phosphate regulon response regulator OmpR n=1 Tax=Novosphingobium kunmingense TaxID=1211806 RepID=A0A2N0H3S3_9SPHN|nr:response regulator [Novosphingobium kunmingense]PKB13578.1 two-component system phosphate regulon response regulator OmpR [Novosphingobium kunmingense]